MLKKLSYPDSNQDKQNQNLLCYHYTIRQSPKPFWVLQRACKYRVFPLFGYQEIVVFLASLKHYVAAVNQIILSEDA